MKKTIISILVLTLLQTAPPSMGATTASGVVLMVENPAEWQIVEQLKYETPLWTNSATTLYNHSASVTNCAEIVLDSVLIQTTNTADLADAIGENEVYASFTISETADIYIAARALKWGVTPIELSDNYLPWLRAGAEEPIGGYEQVMIDENTPAVIHASDAHRYYLYKKTVNVGAEQTARVELGGKSKAGECMYNVFVVFESRRIDWPQWRKFAPNVNYSDKMKMRFRPIDNYISEQNPPDFAWWKVDNALSYDLIVARDKGLTDIAYQRMGLTESYYNFSVPFEPGLYYWSVRFHTKYLTSVWQPPRRFLIEDDAFTFIVPKVSEMMSAFIAKGHPRYYANKDNIESFRQKAEDSGVRATTRSTVSYATTLATLDTTITYTFGEGGAALRNLFWAEVSKGHDRLLAATFLYLANPEEKISGNFVYEYALETLEDMLEFELPPFDEHTDTYLCIYAMNMAIYYDCLYELINPTLRTAILNKINEVYIKAESLFAEDIFHANPMASHQWNCGKYLLTASLLTAGEISRSDEIIQLLLNYYINQTSPYQIEDGAFSSGTGYFRYMNTSLEYMLDRGDIIRLWDKAYYQNQLYYHLYMYPTNSRGGFGDDSFYPLNYYSADMYNRMLDTTKNPIAKWALTKIVDAPRKTPETVYFDDNSQVEPKAPSDMPQSAYFKDAGFAGLHSDLTDDERISLLFRSSWYGTYSHAHNDNNSFIIYGFGEPLAIDSGYYPYFESPHHKNYTMKTYAHNAITFDKGRGQPSHDLEAEGRITGFLTHSDFDYVGGDATGAYKDERGDSPLTLDKAKRHILYIRPDVFVVIDDLKAIGEDEVSFEYWLQSEKEITTYDNDSALIENGNAALYARVQYPNDTTSLYLEGFKGPDGIEYPKEVNGDIANNTPDTEATVHNRIAFKTPAVNETKIVTTLDVHRSNEDACEITKTEFSDYIKLELENTVIYISKGTSDYVDVGGIVFKGAALAVNDNSLMLVEGERLIINHVNRISSDTPVSVVLGKEEMAISNIENDADVSIYYPEISEVSSIKNEKVRAILENVPRNGMSYDKNGDLAEFELYNGQYQIKAKGHPAQLNLSTFSTDFYESEDSIIAFGKIAGTFNSLLLEYGMLYHETNAMPEYDTDGVRIFQGGTCNDRGQYGIELIDSNGVLKSQYYMRAYAIFSKNGVKQPPVYASNSVLVRIGGAE